MRVFPLLLCLGLLCLGLAMPGPLHAAEETLYVRARPSVPLLPAPNATAVPSRQLTPGQAVAVLGRETGFVNVRLQDGGTGWLEEADLTGVVPAAARLAAAEQQIASLERQLGEARNAAADIQARLRRAERNTLAARESGADEVAALAAERDRLQAALKTRDNELAELGRKLSQLEMAREAARLLAAQQVEAATVARSYSMLEIVSAAGAAAALTLLGLWLGASGTRRRIRRRFNGLEL